MEIKEIENEKQATVEAVLRKLPDWFGVESSTQAYIDGVADKKLIVAYERERAVGFLSLKKNFEKSYEIYAMGVLPDMHRKGIGKLLVSKAEDILRDKQVEFLQVKTLSESSPDSNYRRTRLFYSSCGFEPLEEFKTLWGENTPCLLMLKSLLKK